ncbi:hypothetical protein [Micromonospora sp. NBC_01813]|uniref:hypothetical protein n=1 Tax=Micromonospora sp. NBC_01813 TaxID=2975988 RepID=UPI002DDB1452|nr:hypothetical protein [Micromonospora sp. NBC_01813]WSA09757.1 hypothetical protein OG958_02770 [Micromonospora sp. NBC_01813]
MNPERSADRPSQPIEQLGRLSELANLTESANFTPNWQQFKQVCGHPFPTDFQLYVQHFPPGAFGFLTVIHPYEPWLAGDPYRYLEEINFRSEPGNDIPNYYRWGTQPGELITWGTVNGESELCWRITGSDPDRWTCVVADVRDESGEEYPGGMTELLLDVLCATGRVKSLSYLDEIRPMLFEAFDADFPPADPKTSPSGRVAH